MYSSIANHLFQFSHYLLAFIILYLICPRFLFLDKEVTLDSFVANFLKMIFATIIVGYLLAFLKLFEFLSLAIVFILASSYHFSFGKHKHLASEKKITISAYVFNYLDGTESIKKDIKKLFHSKKDRVKAQVNGATNKKMLSFDIALLWFVLLYSAYLRFFDVYYYAAPAMSDGSVTLAWMKYIIQRVIFQDGIYPQGFHIYLATIQKLAFIDPLYILKYSGPFNGVLITFGLYFFVSRTTKERAPALVGAIIYGILGSYLSIDWMRQAATNSQEFGYVFIFPSLYFTYKYLLHRERKYFVSAFSGICITGFVHPIAYAFNVLGVALMGILACSIDFRENFKVVWRVFISGIGSVIIALTPLGIGFLFGKEFHGSSAEFLTEKVQVVTSPQLRVLDYVALCALVLLVGYLIVNFRTLKNQFIEMYVFLFSTVAFVFYYFGGVVTQNAVVATRFSDLWALNSPLAISFGFYVLLKLMRSRIVRWVTGTAVSIGILLATLFYLKPEPILTYKMERNEEVEQYLKISSMCNPTQWVIVSDTQGAYSQILGRGTHIRTNEFFSKYNPNEKYLYYEGTEYKIPDIFIYYDKKLFSFGKSEDLNEELVESTNRRNEANKILETWLEEYKKVHANAEVFYEDDNFMIYHIKQEITQDETLKKIFNN